MSAFDLLREHENFARRVADIVGEDQIRSMALGCQLPYITVTVSAFGLLTAGRDVEICSEDLHRCVIDGMLIYCHFEKPAAKRVRRQPGEPIILTQEDEHEAALAEQTV